MIFLQSKRSKREGIRAKRELRAAFRQMAESWYTWNLLRDSNTDGSVNGGLISHLIISIYYGNCSMEIDGTRWSASGFGVVPYCQTNPHLIFWTSNLQIPNVLKITASRECKKRWTTSTNASSCCVVRCCFRCLLSSCHSACNCNWYCGQGPRPPHKSQPQEHTRGRCGWAPAWSSELGPWDNILWDAVFSFDMFLVDVE